MSKANTQPLIYQPDPLEYRASSHKLKGWTETVEGYCNEAKKLVACALINRQLRGSPYTYAASINVEDYLDPAQHKALWTRAVRKLGAAPVVALWVREPSRSNRVNYHLVVANVMPPEQLTQALEDAMPDRGQVRWHKHVRPIDRENCWLRYIVKAKVSGEVNGRRVHDIYGDKRLLFVPKVGLNKYGTIGPFWAKPKASIWRGVQDRQARIAEALSSGGARRLVGHLRDMLGIDITTDRIRDSVATWAESPVFQDWIADLPMEL